MSNVVTRAIVLSSIKYGDSSLIVQLFTENYGRQSFILSSKKGNRKHQGHISLMPLSIVEVVIVDNQHATLRRIKDVQPTYVFKFIPFDLIRRSITLFLGELFYRSLQENVPDRGVFEFVTHVIEALDGGVDEGLPNFHLYVMYNLVRVLGVAPDVSNGSEKYFDLRAGSYSDIMPSHVDFFMGYDLELWRGVEKLTIESLREFTPTSDERQRILEMLEKYYSCHIPQFQPLKSREVLKIVLR